MESAMRINDLMTTKVFTCGPGSSAAEAAGLMWQHDVGAIPVLDTTGRPIAMVTDRDLCMAAYTRGQPLTGLPVVAAMSKEIFSCREGDSIAEAERLMQAHQVRRLPVVGENGKLVGMLSLNDIVLMRTKTPAAKATERVLGDVTDTLAAICTHRQPPVSAQAGP
jgi:CBS domain-containing protein